MDAMVAKHVQRLPSEACKVLALVRKGVRSSGTQNSTLASDRDVVRYQNPR